LNWRFDSASFFCRAERSGGIPAADARPQFIGGGKNAAAP
jgi:hypothetical protein